MTEGTGLDQLLDAYASVVSSMPVPDLYSAGYGSRYEEACERVCALGERVTDRLLPGASSDQLDEMESRLGFAMSPSVRSWFGWSNGYADQPSCDDDESAYLLPFGRQLGMEESLATVESDMAYLLKWFPSAPSQSVLVLQGWARYYFVDCGEQDSGAVWFWDMEGDCVRAFDSLDELVERSLRLLVSKFVALNHLGAVRIHNWDRDGLHEGTPMSEFMQLWNFGVLPS